MRQRAGMRPPHGFAGSRSSSRTSATGLQPRPGVALYSATRAAAIALVRAVGLEYAATGVTVNAIATGLRRDVRRVPGAAV